MLLSEPGIRTESILAVIFNAGSLIASSENLLQRFVSTIFREDWFCIGRNIVRFVLIICRSRILNGIAGAEDISPIYP